MYLSAGFKVFLMAALKAFSFLFTWADGWYLRMFIGS